LGGKSKQVKSKKAKVKIVELLCGGGLKLGLIGFVFGASGLKLGLIGFELALFWL